MIQAKIAATVLAALAAGTGTYVVHQGDTMSGIAASHHMSLSQLEQDNQQVRDPNLIYVGERLHLSLAGGAAAADHEPDGDGDDAQSAPVQQQGQQRSAPSHTSPANLGGPASAPGGISIPGMPQSLANCIWYRESTRGTNPAAHGNQFGIIPASGYNVSGDSVAQQEQVAGRIYAQSGGGAWAADGCPGT
jgi:hypothetical protein